MFPQTLIPTWMKEKKKSKTKLNQYPKQATHLSSIPCFRRRLISKSHLTGTWDMGFYYSGKGRGKLGSECFMTLDILRCNFLFSLKRANHKFIIRDI